MNLEQITVRQWYLGQQRKLSPQQLGRVQPYIRFLKILLGKLFVQNYRMFSRSPDITIFSKKVAKVTHYLFLKLNWQKTVINLHPLRLYCTDKLKAFSPDRPSNFTMMEVYIKNFSTFTAISDEVDNPRQECYLAVQREKQLAMQSREQFEKLKWIINDYIDRVGSFKEALVEQQLTACQMVLSYDLRLLLNTVNCILAEEAFRNQTCQIESHEWSKFCTQQERWIGQRRDTLLKCRGNVVLIDWIFTQDISNYLTATMLAEIKNTLSDFESNYRDVEMLVYCVKNTREKDGLTYIYQHKKLNKAIIDELKESILNRNGVSKKKNADVITLDD